MFVHFNTLSAEFYTYLSVLHLIIYTLVYRNVRVEPSDLEKLRKLKDLPISYLVNTPSKNIQTHVGMVPVGSGLSTHVSTLTITNQIQNTIISMNL